MFGLGLGSFLMVIIVFVLFVLIINELFKFIKGLIITGIISALFPFFIKFFGFNIEVNQQTITFFVGLGIGLYITYRHFKFLWKISSFIGKTFEKRKK
ncbi:MAG: hypothetical protein J7L43_02015 [Candidatus Aenigmarchaeota archaeon]|nr:hypothetical protein [Candidatus Aenigmarchaeota archaeon]